MSAIVTSVEHSTAATWAVPGRIGGCAPAIFQILLPDWQVAIPTLWLYGYLHERRRSPMSPLQREMVATVVNGLVGGAP